MKSAEPNKLYRKSGIWGALGRGLGQMRCFLLGGEGGAAGIVARQPDVIDDLLELGKMA
jgi:hypothetical protein